MELNQDTLKDARTLLRQKDFGTLSTISIHLDECPFGSVANYCLARDGQPLFYFSTIAQHTKNVEANDKCSLTVLQNGGGNVQAEARITLSGKLVELKDQEEALALYQNYFPESIEYSKFHDFGLYKLEVSMVRYIGGFGKIHWIEPAKFMEASPFNNKEEAFIVDHMNADHSDSLKAYVRAYSSAKQEANDSLHMIGLHAESIDLLHNGHKLNIPTSRSINDSANAREVLVEMAKASA